MTYDSTNRKDIRVAEKAAKLADANRIAYVRQIMGTLGGREWMHDLLSRAFLFHTPHVAGDPYATAFNCGQQNIGLQMFADVIAHTPTEYALMMQEAQVKDEANARRYADNARDARNDDSDNRPGGGSYVTDDDLRPDDDRGDSVH